MAQSEELYTSLILLSQKIIHQHENNPIAIVRQLLLDVDHSTFQSMFDRWGYKHFTQLKDAIEDYYKKVYKQNIKWESNAFKRYPDDFTQFFVFIFDLALKADKRNYIELILVMQEPNQLALQPFIAAITQREDFFISIQDRLPQNTGEQVMQLQEQNQKLKSQGQYWMQKYQDLRESYDYLKLSHDKLSDEVNFLKQDRYQLINELGGSQYGSIEQTVDKVKRQVVQYEKIIERLQKELQEKKSTIKQREEYIRTFQNSFKENNYEQKARQLESTLTKLIQLQKQLQDGKLNEQQLRTQLQLAKEINSQKQKDVDALNNKLNSLQNAEERYNKIKKLHNQFKTKLVKNFKE